MPAERAEARGSRANRRAAARNLTGADKARDRADSSETVIKTNRISTGNSSRSNNSRARRASSRSNSRTGISRVVDGLRSKAAAGSVRNSRAAKAEIVRAGRGNTGKAVKAKANRAVVSGSNNRADKDSRLTATETAGVTGHTGRRKGLRARGAEQVVRVVRVVRKIVRRNRRGGPMWPPVKRGNKC